MRLCARLADGKIVRGETNIDIPRVAHRSPIQEVWLEPEARMNPSLKRIIKNADLIVVGPGIFYTSIIQKFSVPGVKEGIKKDQKRKKFLFAT